MKKYFLVFFLFAMVKGIAQLPDDALRTAWFTQNGTARNMAVGGVMGSLGGDITAAHVNPAGIGLYKTSELVITPGFNLNNNKMNFRGTDSTSSKSSFMYGATGLVFGSVSSNEKSNWVSHAFSISVNQLASYNNHIQYSGFNNYSSFSEQYLEELVRDRADSNAALSNYIFGSSLAFRTYLIDTTKIGNQIGYKSMVPISTGVNQSYDADTKGGYHEIAVAYATNMNDKLYLGGSVTIPIISYQRELNYSETDATNNPNNNFAYFKYHESSKSDGVGVGLKLGMIYKPKEFWRIGFALHTPQWIGFKDQIRSSITANVEGYDKQTPRTATSDELNSGNPGERSYSLLTPMRAIASISYVFREVANTHKQRAFVSADIEYVNYKGAKYIADGNSEATIKDYYNTLNNEIKSSYKGNFNVKLGGELKFDPWMFRLGAAYYGSPYADAALKANRMIASGGVGYRNHGIFIDLTYSQTFVNDVNFPYRLNDVANTYASQKGGKGNIIMTFGIKI